MKTSIIPFMLIAVLTALPACTGRRQGSGTSGDRLQAAYSDSLQPGLVKVANGIVYDVEILNPYPEDEWMNECLEGLDREGLVDFVFDGIYSGRFKAYDIFEGTPVSAKKIRKMEEEGEFGREQIGKFQFMEQWILDTVNMTCRKEVTEIRMGLQQFSPEGELTGYAPLLRVVL